MIKREIILRLIISSIILSILVLSFYVYVTNISNGNKRHRFDISEVIPKIKENYNKTNLDVYKTYDDFLYYDKNSDEIRMYSKNTDSQYYIIGKYGKIYSNPIEIKKENIDYENDINYVSFDTENETIYIKKPTNYVDIDYDTAKTINYYDKNGNIKFDYILLERNGSLNLLNIKTYELTELDSNISDIFIYLSPEEAELKNANNTNYFIALNKNNKYGLIDKNGNTVLDFIYDFLYNSSTNDEYIALKDDKYGLINSKNETILNFEYDFIYYKGNYKIVKKEDKIGIFYNKKLIVDYVIPYYKEDISFENIYTYLENDNLYLISPYIGDYYSNTYWNNSRAYLITKKGIIRKIDSLIEPLYDINKTKINYFYSLKQNNGNINITFYDKDFYEYYTYSFPYEKAYEYNISLNQAINTNYYEIRIYYSKVSLNKTYYVDLFNSKESNEKEALIKYFDNGYSYTLNSDGNLKIYKDNELLNEYNDIEEYFGNYYFYKKNTIYLLKFKKDSN